MRFLIAFVLLVSVERSISTLSSLKICSRDDADLDVCLYEALRAGLPALSGGLNESGVNFPPLDPYYEKEVRFGHSVNQISTRVKLKNLVCSGLSQSKVHKVRANLQDDSLNIEVDMSNENLFIQANYLLEGNYFAIRIYSRGNFNMTMSDLTWTWKIKGVPEVRDGKTYMIIKSFGMRPEVGNMHLNIPVLIKGNAVINSFIVGLIKNEWKEIYGELLPAVENIWNNVGVKLANKIFDVVPYDELFPPEF